ncbi:metallophosphoesterase family protein [bacterium]|nr:metallophosphoesterase family protein [bacterium]
MRVGIFADVHANEEALDVVLSALRQETVDQIICLGDLVGYGPNPNECISKISETADIVIAGNHDWGAIEKMPVEGFNPFARQAITWTQEVLNAESRKILNALPLIQDDGVIMAVHASPELPDHWHYVSSEDAVFRSLMAQTSPYCFIGHTHIPAIYSRAVNGDIMMQKGGSLTLDRGQLHLVNVGSVGQPRDSDPRAAYGILDIERSRFDLFRLPYNIKQVQEKMKDAGLSDFLIQRLTVGQ